MSDYLFRTTSGEAYKADDTILSIGAWAIPAQAGGQAEISIQVIFAAALIPRDGLIKTTILVGCTGARCLLATTFGQFTSWTRDEKEVIGEVSTTTSTGISFKPALTFEAGEKTVELSAVELTEAQQSESRWAGPVQSRLVSRRISSRYLEWDYHEDRGAKRVRDYINETLSFTARCEWLPPAFGHMETHATPHDIRLFNSAHRALGPMASRLVALRLHLEGVKLPSIRPIGQRLDVQELEAVKSA